MKKLLLLFAAMLVAVAATHAQTPTATLSHEGTVKCFYGSNSFVDALAAAVDGDDITLSSGIFSGYNAGTSVNKYLVINKAVNIKGAGMVADTINNVEKTIVVPGNSNETYIKRDNITIEGLYFTGGITLDSTNLKINKCTVMGSLNYGVSGRKSYIYNCRCNSISGNGIINVVNSYVYEAKNSYNLFVINSIIGSTNSSVNGELSIFNSTFYNSIIYNSSTNNDYINRKLPSSNYVYYCLGKNGDGSIFDNVIGYDDGSGNYVPNNTNTVVSDLSTVFKTFNGQNYNEYETFELTTAAASTYLGDDNTQVGMYGGSMPYDPFPSHPIITKLTVAEKSTPQGKLSVDIEVKPAQ